MNKKDKKLTLAELKKKHEKNTQDKNLHEFLEKGTRKTERDKE